MPLKFSQFLQRQEISDPSWGLGISSSGGEIIVGDSNYGTNSAGRILAGGTYSVLSSIKNGSDSSNLDTGKWLRYSSDFSVIIYETLTSTSSSWKYNARLLRRPTNPGTYVDSLIFTSATGGYSTVPNVSGDGSAISYRNNSLQGVILKWNSVNSTWNQLGANLPATVQALNNDGTIAVTDGGNIYRWDGSSWILIQTISGNVFYFSSNVNRLLAISNFTGSKSVYDFNGNLFTQIGNPITQTGGLDGISPDGNVFAVHPNYIYQYISGEWTQIPIQGGSFGGSFNQFSFASDSKKTIIAKGYQNYLYLFELLTVPKITEGQFFSGKVGDSFSATPSLVDGPSVYWQASGLPSGLSINATTGLISGTPTVKGEFTVTVTPSSETTTDSWRWGIASTLTLNIADRDRLFNGAAVVQSVYAGSTPATSVYYGSKKLWPDAV